MKKKFPLIILVFLPIICNAQIYKTISYYDKFDDIIKQEQRKTLITSDESVFIIEEKGRKPVKYHILNVDDAGTFGNKDSIVNLVNDIYGYQTTWCVVRDDMAEEYYDFFSKYFNLAVNSYGNEEKKAEVDKALKAVSKFWLYITKRVIVERYSNTYLDEVFWVYDELNDGKLGKQINRIIYR